jgi:adenosine deaminase
LHLHIEGTLEPELMFALAERNGVALPYASVEEVRAAYRFRDLQGFLDLYYQGMNVLIREQDFHDLAWSYLEKARQHNILYAEIFFDPQAHTRRGIPLETVLDGLHRAITDARATLGVRAVGFHAVAHAGEEGPAAYITHALDVLHAERIDHGVRCLEDPELVARLARDRIPLTVCPLSNVRLGVVDDIARHPLPELIERGLYVTLNSDDPAYFGGYLNENYQAVAEAFALPRQTLCTLARNSFEAAFLDGADKAAYVAKVDSYEAAG